MEQAFYIAAIVAVATTLRVITHRHPVHALLYLIASLLAVAVAFYTLGAPFAAVLEVIVYAGAIVVLFVFVVMMLPVDDSTVAQEGRWLDARGWIGPGAAAAVLLVAMLYALAAEAGKLSGQVLGAKEVGMALFGPYLLLVELASFLLLAALVIAGHLGRD